MGYMAKRLNEFHWGQFLLSKIQWIINLIILLKLFGAPAWAYLVSPLFIIVATWVIGYIIEKTGFRLRIVRENFKGTNIE